MTDNEKLKLVREVVDYRSQWPSGGQSILLEMLEQALAGVDPF